MELTLVVRATEDGVRVFGGMACGVPPESVVWLTISGPKREFPSQEHLTKSEFREWVHQLKRDGYTIHAKNFKGNPVDIDV